MEFTIFTNTLSFVIFWVGFGFVLTTWTYIVYDWDKNIQHKKGETYFLSSVCCFYMFLGIMSCIFIMPDTINKANEYDKYQGEVIMPIESRYNNVQLPDGHYYLGVEITNTHKNGDTYTYDLGVVDYKERNDIFQYETDKELNPDVPYMLVMDSLGTDDVTDDQIVVVWACVE